MRVFTLALLLASAACADTSARVRWQAAQPNPSLCSVTQGASCVPGENALYLLCLADDSTGAETVSYVLVQKWLEGSDTPEWNYSALNAGLGSQTLASSSIALDGGDLLVAGNGGWYLVDKEPYEGFVMRLAGDSGKRLWASRRAAPAGCTTFSMLAGLTSEGHVLVIDTVCDAIWLRWIDALSGADVATSMLGDTYSGHALSHDGKHLFIHTNHMVGALRAYDVTKPREDVQSEWVLSLGSAGLAPALAPVAAGTPAAAAGGCLLSSCFDAMSGATVTFLITCDGEFVWQTNLMASILTETGDYVVAYTSPYNDGPYSITWLNATTGVMVWSFVQQDPLISEITSLFSSASQGQLYGVQHNRKTSSGRTILRFATPNSTNVGASLPLVWSLAVESGSFPQGPFVLDTTSSLPMLMGYSGVRLYSIEQTANST